MQRRAEVATSPWCCMGCGDCRDSPVVCAGRELPGAFTIVSPPDKVALVWALALSWSVPYHTSEESQGYVTIPPVPTDGKSCLWLPQLSEGWKCSLIQE